MSPIHILLYTARHNPKVVALGRPKDLVLRFPRQLHLYLDLARERAGVERDVYPAERGLRIHLCCCGVESGVAVRERRPEIIDSSRCVVESSVAVRERRPEIIDFSRCGVEPGVSVCERRREIIDHFL